MEELIEQSVVSAFNVKVFGEAISKTPTKSKVLTAEFGASTLTYVKVHGVQLNGICTRMENPITLILPGEGIDPKGCGFDDAAEIKMWQIRKDQVSSKLQLTSGTIEDLLTDELKGLIDAGIKIKNVSYSNGKLKGRIEIWVKVGVTIREAIEFSIDAGLSQWITITGFDIGIADIKVQVKLDSLHKICGRLEACADFPWPIGEQCAKATECIEF